jgi:hypothetical protein
MGRKKASKNLNRQDWIAYWEAQEWPPSAGGEYWNNIEGSALSQNGQPHATRRAKRLMDRQILAGKGGLDGRRGRTARVSLLGRAEDRLALHQTASFLTANGNR